MSYKASKIPSIISKQAACALYTLTKHLLSTFHKPKKGHSCKTLRNHCLNHTIFQEVAPPETHHVERLIPPKSQGVTPSASSSQPKMPICRTIQRKIAPNMITFLAADSFRIDSKVSGPCFGRFQLHFGFQVTCHSSGSRGRHVCEEEGGLESRGRCFRRP
jgi:hypothetical protein